MFKSDKSDKIKIYYYPINLSRKCTLYSSVLVPQGHKGGKFNVLLCLITFCFLIQAKNHA